MTTFAMKEDWRFDGHITNNSLALSPDETTAVVSISSDSHVIVYDLVKKTIRGQLDQFISPRNILFHPDGNAFYVSDSSHGTVEKIDTKTLRTLSTFVVGPGAFGTAISKDGSTLYINNQAANTLTIYDLINEHPKIVLTGFSQPRQGIKLSPNGKLLYVTNFIGSKIIIVETVNHQIIGEITGFTGLRAISVSSDGKTLYAANSANNTIAIVDLNSYRITHHINVGKEPYGVVLSQDETKLYTGNRADNSISVVDLSLNIMIASITGFDEPRQAIIITRDGINAWVLNKDLSLYRVNLNSNSIEEKISSH